tara:strand:+ start:105 stop:572 length:468 start_codon:yes stop_codon:yes gene_type:complete
MNKLETIEKPSMKTSAQDIRPGDVVRVHQKVKEGDKQRIQVFEGVVLAKKHGRGVGATITLRKVTQGVGVERIFPIHSPLIKKIEVARRAKVRRSKLYYLREAKGRKARLKARGFNLEVPEEEPIKKPEEPQEQPAEEQTKKQSEDQSKEEQKTA